ncbi:LssY C-terminal domain-containing protein [Corynebacterium sp. c7Ub_26]
MAMPSLSSMWSHASDLTSMRKFSSRTPREKRIDNTFFLLAGLAAIWLAGEYFKLSFVLDFRLLLIIPAWGVIAYLTPPRLHRILTRIYVPNYFIGRTRTSDGLLGDPVNIAFDGTAEQLHRSMTEAGWTVADPVTFRSSAKIVWSSITRASYPAAPVSPLILFDREQDLAYQQEVDGSPSRRHHIRLWRCPKDWPLPGGHRVDWVGSASYDTAVGVSFFTLQVTHRIAADIDRERDHVVSTVRSYVPESSVSMIEDFSTGYHHVNGGGDKIHTDGDLPIVDVSRVGLHSGPHGDDGASAEETSEELPDDIGADASSDITDSENAEARKATAGNAVEESSDTEPLTARGSDNVDSTINGTRYTGRASTHYDDDISDEERAARRPKNAQRTPRPPNLMLSMGMLFLVVAWQSVVLLYKADQHRFIPGALQDMGFSHHTAYVATQWYVGLLTLGTLILVLLTLGGFTHARDALMLFLTIAIVISILDRNGMRMIAAGHNNLLLTTATIIALLALSSDDVRNWIRGHEPAAVWGPVRKIHLPIDDHSR